MAFFFSGLPTLREVELSICCIVRRGTKLSIEYSISGLNGSTNLPPYLIIHFESLTVETAISSEMSSFVHGHRHLKLGNFRTSGIFYTGSECSTTQPLNLATIRPYNYKCF